MFSFIADILTCYSYIMNSKVFKYLFFSCKFAVKEVTAEKDVTPQPKEQTCAGSRSGCLFQDAVSSL